MTPASRRPTRSGDRSTLSLRAFAFFKLSLPVTTLEHRLSQCLEVDANLLGEDNVLFRLDVPALVVAGDESRRLETVMSRCERVVVDSAGRFALDDRANPTELVLAEPATRRKRCRRGRPVRSDSRL